MGWNVLIAIRGQEFKAAKVLLDIGVEAYCPELTPKRKVRRGRVVLEPEAMVPGYLFVPAIDHDWHRIRMAKGIFSGKPWIERDGRPALVSDRVIDALRENEQSPEQFRRSYRIGQKVRVADRASPWNDLVGEIGELNDKGLMRVLLDLFGRKVRVPFGEEQVEAA